MATNENCKACRFFTTREDTKLRGYGKCRRFPPMFDTSDNDWNWPTLHASDWCGEFKAHNRVMQDE